jgi:biotin carboxyl carrier protein
MKVQVVIGGVVYDVEVEDTRDESEQRAPTEGIQSIVLPAPGSTPLAGVDVKIYCSPVAGLVVRVNVEAGQVVQVNDLLLVLEAMKMETSIAATTAGKVKSVHVSQGSAVKIGQLLLEFE